MADWLDELAEALGEPMLADPEVGAILNAAREIAHRVERKATPLSTYLVGVAVGRASQTTDRAAELQSALAVLMPLLPEPSAEDDTTGPT